MQKLQDQIVACEACPRLRAHCTEVARVKRRAYRDFDYWGKPVPSFGDPKARLFILGLAPGAHGANRTGRMFTGDRSGDFLFRSLFDAGFASQPHSATRDDGLTLNDAWISAPVHCAPPDNKPALEEIRQCSRFLEVELGLLKNLQVVVCLGRISLDAYATVQGLRKRALQFGHNVVQPGTTPLVITSYHPSQQNTQTGRLTQAMLTAVFAAARARLR